MLPLVCEEGGRHSLTMPCLFRQHPGGADGRNLNGKPPLCRATQDRGGNSPASQGKSQGDHKPHGEALSAGGTSCQSERPHVLGWLEEGPQEASQTPLCHRAGGETMRFLQDPQRFIVQVGLSRPVVAVEHRGRCLRMTTGF